MPKRKKAFPCGHKGFGQSCHLCQQSDLQRQQHLEALAMKKQEKQAWLATFAEDVVDLSRFPKPIVIKARSIITGLEQGANYLEFGGKRLNHNRNIISIPITRHYRMICKDTGNRIIPKEVLSHEAYNMTKPGSRIS